MTDLKTRLNELRDKLGFPEPSYDVDLLDRPQFTNMNVQHVAEVTHTQLHNWTSRGWINLSGDATPGKGRRRFYTGRDVLAVRLAAEMAPFAMMQVAKQVHETSGWLHARAVELLCAPPPVLGRKLFVIMTESDWLYVHDISALPQACPVYLTIETDLLILQTLERLACVVEEEDIAPLGKPASPSSDEMKREMEEFYGVWSNDDEGRLCYSGLTFEESKEFAELDPIAESERLHNYDDGPFEGGLSGNQEKRHEELQERHFKGAQEARMKKVAPK